MQIHRIQTRSLPSATLQTHGLCVSQVGYSKREDRLLHESTPGCSLWKRPPVRASLKLEGKHESCMSDLWYYWTDCQMAKIIHLLLTLKVETEIITAIILNSLVEPNHNWSKLLWHLAQRHRTHLTSQPLENKLLRPVSYYSFLFSLISKKQHISCSITLSCLTLFIY